MQEEKIEPIKVINDIHLYVDKVRKDLKIPAENEYDNYVINTCLVGIFAHIRCDNPKYYHELIKNLEITKEV